MSLTTMADADTSSTMLADWGESMTYTHTGLTSAVSLSGLFGTVRYRQPVGDGIADVTTCDVLASDLVEGATPVTPERGGTVVRGSTTYQVIDIEQGLELWRLSLVASLRGVP